MDTDVLGESVHTAREAIKATPRDLPDAERGDRLASLASQLGARYLCKGTIEDLEEAICASRTAVEGTLKDDPDLAKRLHGLGKKLRTKYSRTKVPIDLEEASQCFQTALHHDAAPFSIRINVGRTLFSFMDGSPRMRQASPYSPARARSWRFVFSTGRGVLASSLQDLRVDTSALEERHPELARSFVTLRDQLDAPSSQGGADAEARETSGGTDQRHKAVNRMPVLLEEIRSSPGFKDFLLPPSEAEAARGPIVILNVSRHRCDALIVEQTALREVQLSHLSPKKILAQAPHVRSIEMRD
ncbi:hypothetical protein FGADI_5594 [Fusarium gaditjirri]|uniref:Uncharacterized protein n=1 Tax=Fusarium gaditjirri TaxID=282569 RepID=A0A8H4WXT8_9HYPO|nr:hypothetical protein FGADI_5594 [Fusarium gaditjirri]